MLGAHKKVGCSILLGQSLDVLICDGRSGISLGSAAAREWAATQARRSLAAAGRAGWSGSTAHCRTSAPASSFGNILLRQRPGFGNINREAARPVRIIVADQSATADDDSGIRDAAGARHSLTAAGRRPFYSTRMAIPRWPAENPDFREVFELTCLRGWLYHQFGEL